MQQVDLNADLGEESPHEAELFAVVTSANISCGAHAGGGEHLKEAVRSALAHGVAIGAHPSYPDRHNFGRISMLTSFSHDELFDELREQLRFFYAVVRDEGAKIHHIKAHGALYNDALVHVRAADTLIKAVTAFEREHGLGQLPLLTMQGELSRLAEKQDRPVIFEFFADRSYRPDGTLVPRSEPDAVLHDADVIADRVLTFIHDHRVLTQSDTWLTLQAESICVHGDNPDALAIAQRLSHELLEAGVSVRAV